MPALSGNSLEIRRGWEATCSLPNFILYFFSFARQKKGSGFFFCAKHAPALRAAGAAALQACSPAPPAARPRHRPGPSLGYRSAPAAPLLAPGRPSSGCSCSVLAAPALCFHSTLQKLLPHPSSSLHALPAPLQSPPKNRDLQTVPSLSCEALDASSWPRYFQDSLQPPLPSGGLFTQALHCPEEPPPRWLLWGWSFRPPSHPPPPFSPLELKDPSNLALSH